MIGRCYMYYKDLKHCVKVRLHDDDFFFLSHWAEDHDKTISDAIRNCIGAYRRLNNDKQTHINYKL